MSNHQIPVTPSAYTYPLLLKHLLHTPLAHYPDQEIVFRKERRYTYRVFRDRIGRLASGLASLGIKQGDTVAMMDWDSHRYLECYFTIPMMGAVLQTVNVRLAPEQILYTLNHAKADVVIVHADFMAMLDSLRPKLTSVKKFVLIADGATVGHAPDAFSGEYEDLVAGGDPDYDFPEFDENTRATTFYTTGTTGNPKGVYFSHRQLVLHTLMMTATLSVAGGPQSVHRGDVYMPMTPMFHVHGWGFPYVATMMGMKQVYAGRFIPEESLELIEREKVTFSHCVPTILHLLLNVPKSAEVSLRGMKIMIGGSILPKGLAKQALDRGIDVFAAYGMSETCPLLAISQIKPDLVLNDRNEEINLRCKTGLPAPLVDLRVVDENMNDLPRDGKSVGEIVVRAPWLTMGYLNDPGSSEKLWKDGYMHTQDIGSIDKNGYLQITDRIKDVIKSGGEWISSIEIESLISQHPAVSEVAVIGVSDEKWGERPLVLIVPKAGGELTDADIMLHVKKFSDAGTISRFAIPDRVLFVKQIEKTSVGKIDKKVLREKYGKQTAKLGVG